jgi:CDP-glucose 4,6-dehydratase
MVEMDSQAVPLGEKKASLDLQRGYSWQDAHVFVTGATGLLGSWLVKELQGRGALVVALVRDRVPQSHLWTVADVKNLICVHGILEDYPTIQRSLNEYEIETVFHLGAQTIVSIANRNPLSTFESNIRGTYHMLEACRLSPTVKVLAVASSDKAYGTSEKLPYDESTSLVGRHPYDVSKSCADLLSMAYYETYRLPVCVTRCGNFYGAGDLNFNRIIPGTIRSILRGQTPVIRSDGTYVRDYFYIHDAALAYLHLAEAMHTKGIAGEAFNFSNEIQVTVLELVGKILRLMDSDLEPIIKNEVTGEIFHQYLSAAKARNSLGWRPRYSLEEGLKETIAWYREFLTRHPKWPDKDPGP